MSSKSELTMTPYILSHCNLATDIQHMQKQLFVSVPSVFIKYRHVGASSSHTELHAQELSQAKCICLLQQTLNI